MQDTILFSRATSKQTLNVLEQPNGYILIERFVTAGNGYAKWYVKASEKGMLLASKKSTIS